jgi:hypothetical protein
MDLLGDVGHVESRFDLFGDGVSISAREVHVCAKRTMPQESFCTHPMALVGDKAQMEARFDLFGDSANHNSR